MEDFNVLLVCEIASGLGGGGLNRALVEPYIKFSARSQCTSDSA